MNQAQCQTSRRDALQRGLVGVAGAVLFWATRDSVAAGKLTKAAVGYAEAGNGAGQDCDDCIQFVAGSSARAPATCKIVEGTISPHGHCIAFSPKE